jgi:UDPglucose--hexose-1-phosphate uridylyltransferase
MDKLAFEQISVSAGFISPAGRPVEIPVEIRTHPITGRTCRIALGRSAEKEPGTQALPEPPPDWAETAACPFCRPRVFSKTPRALSNVLPEGRLVRGDSVLFPNLFPYGRYSAVSLFDDAHFVEIGTASAGAYADCFMNCAAYLRRVLNSDPEARFMAITQNHLPSAGGSLVHPHLQVNADRIAANHQRFLRKKAEEYHEDAGTRIFSDYLLHEREDGRRYIGATGRWEWVAAFAPEGFYEIWGIYPGATSLFQLSSSDWRDLADGVIRVQRFYRSLCRNGYNLGILSVEDNNPWLELRVVVLARSNYAPWVRNDHTGFEVMLGDMATFTAPEEIAGMARPFWGPQPG